MKQELELKLQAWLDGELPPAEAEAMSRLAESDAEARSLVAALQGIRAALSQSEQPITVPETREFYWSKIQQQIERAEKVRPKLPWSRRWRLWLAPLAGASALAAVLLITLHPASNTVALINEVSVTAAGYQARTAHDKNTGMNFVFLQSTDPSDNVSGGQLQPARPRDEGSSFMIDIE